jgi:hypothetical protein
MSNMDSIKTAGEPRCLWRVSSSWLLQDIRCITHT